MSSLPPVMPTSDAQAGEQVGPRSLRFRRAREGQWQELHLLTERALRKGLQALTEDELNRLPTLYRTALSGLAVARATALDRALVQYLEALAARAYLAVYGARKATRRPLTAFFLERFPAEVRALAPELGIATLFFGLGALLAFALSSIEPEWYYAFIDPGMSAGRDPGATTKSLRDALYDTPQGGLGLFSASLFAHNYGIGMAAFALGFLAGIPTALLLTINGFVLGAFVSLYYQRGLLWPLLGWLLPHGIPEIFGILLCGAAGLALGRAVLWPGERTLTASLMHHGQRAALVVGGSVILFAVAGIVEGVFRQTIVDDQARLALAGFNALWLTAWLATGTRRPARVPATLQAPP